MNPLPKRPGETGPVTIWVCICLVPTPIPTFVTSSPLLCPKHPAGFYFPLYFPQYSPHIFSGASSSSRIGWLRKISLDFKHSPLISFSWSWTFLPGFDPRTVGRSQRSVIEINNTPSVKSLTKCHRNTEGEDNWVLSVCWGETALPCSQRVFCFSCMLLSFNSIHSSTLPPSNVRF